MCEIFSVNGHFVDGCWEIRTVLLCNEPPPKKGKRYIRNDTEGSVWGVCWGVGGCTDTCSTSPPEERRCRREEGGRTERKGRLKKKSSVSEAFIARDHTPETYHVYVSVNEWTHVFLSTQNMCMFMRMWFQPIDLCLPEIKLMSYVCLVLRSLIFWFPLFS